MISKKKLLSCTRTCLTNNNRDYMRAPKACYFVTEITSFLSFDNNSIVTQNIEMIRPLSPHLPTRDAYYVY